MAIEETFRREFQTRVEEALDAESARFLMAHLPPVPWPEVATKHDLDLLAARVDSRFDTLEASIDGRFKVAQKELGEGLANQRADLMELMSTQTRTMIIALITAVVALSAVALFR